MSLPLQLARVESKLDEVRRRDTSFSLFGSDTHRYRLNRTATDSAIKEFETSHGIELPVDYRWFIGRSEMAVPARSMALGDTVLEYSRIWIARQRTTF